MLQRIKNNFNRIRNGFLATFIAVFAFVFLTHVTQATTDLKEGEVKVSKTAKAVDGKLNTWEITLNIQARDAKKTSDTVLVIDRSGSMKGTKLANAKTAANNFINTLLPTGNTTNRIAIVSFGGDATKEIGFTGAASKSSLISKVGDLSADGGTYTQLAIHYAQDYIATSNADFKNIVLLSDGQPTYSSAVPNLCSNRTGVNAWVTGSETNTKITHAGFDNHNNRVGNGSDMVSGGQYCDNYSTYYSYNHGNSTIAEAGFSKSSAKVPTIYTVALSAGTAGNNVLNSVASADSAYTGDEADLQAIFNRIAGNILAAAKDISISDTVADKFKIVSYDSTDGVKTNNDKTVTWSKVQLGNADTNGVRTATKKITIQLDAPNDANISGQLATNTDVHFKYTDSDGKPQDKSPSSPMVNPVLIHTEKVLNGSKVNSTDKFTIDVKNGGKNYGSAFMGSGTYISTEPVTTGNYAITEDINNSSQYGKTIEYKIGVSGTWTLASSFSVNNEYQGSTDGSANDNDVYVRVANVALNGTLKISKQLADCNKSSAAFISAPNKTFTFYVTGPNGYSKTVTATVSTTQCPAVVTVADNLAQGSYTITETNADDYTATPGKTQTVTVGLGSNLAQTVSFANIYSKKTSVTAKKIWQGGNASDHKVNLVLGGGPNDLAITRTKEANAVNGQAVSWTNLPAGDEYGNPYTYTVSESNLPTGYAQVGGVVINNGVYEITNKYTSPTDSVTATKKWVNGPASHPDVQFELYRKVGNGSEVKVEDSLKTVTSGTSNSKTVTWTNMPKYNNDGLEYTYLVHEVGQPTNYTKNEDGLTVTNTYKIPTGPVSATKVWTGGANATKPTVYFKLYRQIGSAAPEVASAELKEINGTVTTAQWTGLELTDNNGNEYTFSVKEVNANGTPFTSNNYTVSESGLTVTNTYKSTDRTITVNKTWVGGKTSDHVASFTLYRDGVAVSGSTKTITGNNSASWTVPVTDDQGNVYTYTVGEAAVANYESSCGFLAILCAVNNDGVANITNTYKIPTNGVFAATKVWDGGPLANTPVQIQLYQGSNAYGTPVTTVNNIASWTNLPETDSNGNKLSYSVKEVTGLPNYKSIVSNETPVSATITNKYESPKIPVVANKTWVNGDSQNRPEIYFQLYRKISGGIDQAVGTAQKVVNDQVNFGQQDKTDVTGKEYTYFVKEVNASGVNVAPANYTKNEDGLTVTNTYVAPQNGTFTATKVWEGGARAGEEVQIQLMQNGVDFRAAQTTSSLTTSWSNLPVTDDSGVAYAYTVREVSDFSADHYEAPFVTYNGNSATIKNKFTSPKIDVNVTKIWVGGADRPAVTLQLKRTAGNTTENVSTKTITSPATTAVWEDEPQFNGAGIEYVYSVIETNVPTNYAVSYGTDANGLTVTNTYGSPKTQFTATKVWVDGPAVHPTIELQLMRDGSDFGDKVSLTNGTTTYTWTGLDQTDPNGKVYSYTVKEITVFEDYTMSQTGNTITNTYKSLPRTISASKVWDGGLVSTHVTRFTLNGGPADMTGRTQSVTGDATVTWTVPANDNNGAPYTYTVSEEKVNSYDADCDTNCVLDENGNVTITNTYKSPPTKVTALKHWVNGPTDRPDVKLQLVRNGVDVTGEIATLTSATGWSYTWSNLDKTGHDGVDYTYTVRELDLGPKYDATYSDNKLEVTNTYVIPKDGEATATKTWVNGGSLTRPTIYFQLYRAISGGAAEVVPGAAIKELVNGTTQATWTELETTDINGNPYTFSVKEVDANGSDATPDTYSKVEEGLNVTNTYTSPKTTFTAKKIWNGGPSARPTIQIQLYQNGVALGAPITLVNGVTEFTWNDLDLTDKDGVTYEYAVDEIGVPSDYKLIGINRTENGAELTNNYIGTPGMGGGKPPVELPKTGIDASSRSPLIIALAGLLTYGAMYFALPRSRRDEI